MKFTNSGFISDTRSEIINRSNNDALSRRSSLSVTSSVYKDNKNQYQQELMNFQYCLQPVQYNRANQQSIASSRVSQGTMSTHYTGKLPVDDMVNLQFQTTNSRIDTIQNQVNIIQNQVNTIQGQVNTIQGQVNTIQGQVNGVMGQVHGLNGRVGNIQDQIKSLSERLSNIEGQISNISQRVGKLEGRVDNLSDRVDKLERIVKNLQEQVKLLNENMRRLEDQVKTVNGRVGNLQLQVNRLVNQVNSLEIAMTRMQQQLKTLKNELTYKIQQVSQSCRQITRTIKDMRRQMNQKFSNVQKSINDHKKQTMMTKDRVDKIQKRLCPENFHEKISRFLSLYTTRIELLQSKWPNKMKQSKEIQEQYGSISHTNTSVKLSPSQRIKLIRLIFKQTSKFGLRKQQDILPIIQTFFFLLEKKSYIKIQILIDYSIYNLCKNRRIPVLQLNKLTIPEGLKDELKTFHNELVQFAKQGILLQTLRKSLRNYKYLDYIQNSKYLTHKMYTLCITVFCLLFEPSEHPYIISAISIALLAKLSQYELIHRDDLRLNRFVQRLNEKQRNIVDVLSTKMISMEKSFDLDDLSIELP